MTDHTWIGNALRGLAKYAGRNRLPMLHESIVPFRNYWNRNVKSKAIISQENAN